MNRIYLIIFCFVFSIHVIAQQKTTIQITPIINGEPFVLNKIYTQQFEINTLKFYISNLTLLSHDSIVWSNHSNYYLINYENEQTNTLILMLPKNIQFDKIMYDIGIDSATNYAGAQGGDLDPTKGMYWTWQNGYINFKIEGNFYENNKIKQSFQYHIGGYQNGYVTLQTIALDLLENEHINIKLDIDKLTNIIQQSQINTITSPNESAVNFSKNFQKNIFNFKVMRISKIILFFISIVCMAFVASENYELKYPSYFPKPVYNFKNNELTQSKINLGRALFYDNILSKNNTISCASCHSNYNAFSHTDHTLSHGIYDSIGKRNAPALMNLAWQKNFMWDGAINHLDMQALAPLHSKIEMDENINDVITKLSKSKIYPSLFYKAYHDSIITGEHFLKSISAFMLSIVSFQSRYDSMRQDKILFNTQEKNGYTIFKKNCNACHTEPLFTNNLYECNGLNIDTFLQDYGRVLITKNKNDTCKFKVPTLRNIEYTFPYMHDGRYKSLQQVLTHYTHIDTNNSYTSIILKNKIQLSSNEKVDLISFLLTLSDRAFLFNPAYAFPRKILLPSAKD